MSTQWKALKLLPAVALAVALGAVGSSATAANVQRVEVLGSKLEVGTARHLRTGIEDEGLRLSRRVSYADLDLATARGANELTGRIERAATAVCGRLEAIDPASSLPMQWQEERLCFDGAVRDAMKQARVAVASAKEQ